MHDGSRLQRPACCRANRQSGYQVYRRQRTSRRPTLAKSIFSGDAPLPVDEASGGNDTWSSPASGNRQHSRLIIQNELSDSLGSGWQW